MVRRSKKTGQAKLSKETTQRIRNQLSKTGTVNPYEAMLIQMGSNAIGIPDEYPHETCKITLKTVIDLPWIAGQTRAVIGHSLDRFVEVLGGPAVIDSSYKLLSNNCAGPGVVLVSPLGDVFGNIHTALTQVDMYAVSISKYNTPLGIPGMFDETGNPVPSDSGGFVYANPGDVITITAVSSDTTANAWSPQVYCRYSDGSTSLVTGTALTGNGTYITGPVTLPANVIGIRYVSIVRLLGTGALTCPGLSSSFYNFFTLSRLSGTSVIGYPIGDAGGLTLETLKTSSGRYRIAANKVWVQYRGNQFANGSITCGQLPTTDLHYLPDMSLQTIALIPDSYNGPLSKGAYMWKRPLDSSDFTFEDLENPNDDTGSVFVLFASAQAADAEHLTLVIETNIELQTANQVFARSTNEIDPPMIWAAQANLKGFPSAMENPTHFADIARKLFGDAKKASLAVAQTAKKWAPLIEMVIAAAA